MITGKTDTGFEFKIEPSTINNMEFVDAIAEAEEDFLKYSKVVRMLLGTEQRQALYDHVRKEDGTVPIEAVAHEVEQILLSSAETKN